MGQWHWTAARLHVDAAFAISARRRCCRRGFKTESRISSSADSEYILWRCRSLTPVLSTGRHRRQGPSPWSSCLHRRQAASQRPEDRRCPHRGPQHLWRVLPCQAYVDSPSQNPTPTGRNTQSVKRGGNTSGNLRRLAVPITRTDRT